MKTLKTENVVSRCEYVDSVNDKNYYVLINGKTAPEELMFLRTARQYKTRNYYAFLHVLSNGIYYHYQACARDELTAMYNAFTLAFDGLTDERYSIDPFYSLVAQAMEYNGVGKKNFITCR